MENDKNMISASKIRISPKDSATVTDALYSSPISSSIEESDGQSPSQLPPEPTEPQPTFKADAVSTGTFGNLIKKVNDDPSMEDRAAKARQRIRFNLMKVGPRRKSTDECEAWRKYLF